MMISQFQIRDADVIPLTLQIQLPQVMQGSPPCTGRNPLLIHPTNTPNEVSSQLVEQAFDQERACWIGQGRQALQHQRGQFEVAPQQYEEANRQQLHHAVEHANTTANVELTQGVQTLASSSEARFSTQPRQLLSRLSTEATAPTWATLVAQRTRMAEHPSSET